MPRLAGLVLAGGASRRFGTDKALVVVEGVTLLDRAVACLRAVCDRSVLVASGDGTSRPDVADGQVADLGGGPAGPLAGIAAGLGALRDEAPAVAVLAVDHPAPSAALLRLLVDRRGDAVCALAERAGWRQPLHAVWATAAADAVGDAVRRGVASPTRWLAARDDVLVLDERALRAAGIDPAVTRDVDRPADLR